MNIRQPTKNCTMQNIASCAVRRMVLGVSGYASMFGRVGEEQ